jgi:hypothetical protein
MTVVLLGLMASVSLAQAPTPQPLTNTWNGTGTSAAYATFKASVSQFAQVTITPPGDFTIPSGSVGTQTVTRGPNDPGDYEHPNDPGDGGLIDYETNCAVKSDIEVFEMNSAQDETWRTQEPAQEPAIGERIFTQYKLGALWEAMTLSNSEAEPWFGPREALLDWTTAFDGQTVTGTPGAGDYGGTKLVKDLAFDPADCRYARIWWGVKVTNKARDGNFKPGSPSESNYTMPPEATDYRGVMIVTLHP